MQINNKLMHQLDENFYDYENTHNLDIKKIFEAINPKEIKTHREKYYYEVLMDLYEDLKDGGEIQWDGYASYDWFLHEYGCAPKLYWEGWDNL